MRHAMIIYVCGAVLLTGGSGYAVSEKAARANAPEVPGVWSQQSDKEYAERVRNTQALGVALAFIMSEQEKRLLYLVRKGVLRFGAEQVTQANVDDYARWLDRKRQILSDAMNQRGFISVAGVYDVQIDTNNECSLPPDPLGPITVVQDKFMVEFEDAAGVLNGKGAIVESSLAINPLPDGLSPLFLLAEVAGDRAEIGYLDTDPLAKVRRCKIGFLTKRGGAGRQ